MLDQDAVELSTSGADFYSHVFVVPKHTGGLQLIVSSDSVATCTYLLLRCLLSYRYGNLFSKVIVLSLLI